MSAQFFLQIKPLFYIVQPQKILISYSSSKSKYKKFNYLNTCKVLKVDKSSAACLSRPKIVNL